MLKRILKLTSLLYIISVISLFLLFKYSSVRIYLWKDIKFNAFDKQVQIWSKAAIGEYLWTHILNGSLEVINKGFYQNGNVTFNGITFSYFSGPGYIQTTLPQNVKYLILVLNGRTVERSLKAREWLDYLWQLQSLNKLAVILLGNENCEDQWIIRYLKSRGGIVDILFIVYDSPLVDNTEVFQWPLGVATYRGFPNVDSFHQLETSPRKYVCNFMGTVYKNSSRQKLVEIMSKSYFRHKCYIHAREQWLPNESAESLNKYIDILSKSLLTLSPSGKNPESYRIYEAVSLGSIPVIVMEPSQGQCINPPLRLLIRYNAPIIKYSTWEEAIQSLTSTYLDLPYTSNDMISWYAAFKTQLASQFIQIIYEKFNQNC